MYTVTSCRVEHWKNRGFTLAELAIVLVIVALLSGGLMVSLSSQIEQRARNETERQLQDAHDALFGFAASHTALDGKPYLPCPDTDGDGVENRSANICTNQEGTLPWSDLGLGNSDAWNNRFRYRVDSSFSNRAAGFTLTTVAVLRVCDQVACTSLLATNLPVVILSHGRNGLGATNLANATNAMPTSADELENTDGDDDFMSHTATPIGAGEFDDIVTWLSPNLLYNRLIAAGRLP